MIEVIDKYGILKRPSVLGVSSWGNIVGTLTTQTDLTSYLTANYVKLLSGSGVITNNNLTTTTATAGLYLSNTTSATSGVTQQNSPALIFSGSAWVSGALKTNDIAIQSEPQSWDSTRMIYYKRLNNGSWIPFFGLRSDSTNSASTFLYPVGYLKDGIGQTVSNGFQLANGITATSTLQQYSPSLQLFGYGWNGTASSLMTFDYLLAPEAGTTDVQGVAKFLYQSSLANELVRYEWGERLGMVINKLSLPNYVTTINSKTIITNGNVGIGTATPSTTLQVSSATNQGVVIGTTSYPNWMGTDGLYVDGQFRANTYLLGSGGSINWGASQAQIMGYNPSTGSDTYLSFLTGGISAYGERMRIIDNGNVGIGTTIPSAKLQVQGSITAASAIARGTYIAPTLVAAANNDVLVGLDIAPTFTLGAFTGTTSAALRVSGNIIPSVNATYDLGTPSLNFTRVRAQNVVSNGSLSLYSGGALGLTVASSANILIGTATDTASSILKLESTTKGFLPPRMTNAQRVAIASPAIGLMVYCTDTVEGIYVYKSTGWTFIG